METKEIEEILVDLRYIMNLIQAIKKVAQRAIIVSCTGRTYTCEMLQPKWFGEYYASFMTCGMTDIEKKGVWKIENKYIHPRKN